MSEEQKHQVKYQGQFDQDKWVNENIFKNRRNGTFLDIGAHKGIGGNNTYFFEYQLGWKGLCIEGNPKMWKELDENRPNATNIHGCAYKERKMVEFRINNGPTETLSGIEDKFDPRHVNRIKREQVQNGGDSELVQVQAYTITELCEEHDMKVVDFVSLDVEGSEIDVLEGIDFDKIHINVLTIENNYWDDARVRNFLMTRGFKYVQRLCIDEVFVNSNFIFSEDYKVSK